jgi:hypothetical protein
MKYPNIKSETFFRNLLKHSLKPNEWKVLVAFIVDHPTDYHIALPELVKRTRIKKPNVSRAIRGLKYMGILVTVDGNLELSSNILDSEYSPQEVSTKKMRNEEEAKHTKGNGNFKRQAEIKKENADIAEKNIKRMIKETNYRKKKVSNWETYYSEYYGKEIQVLINEQLPSGRIKFCSGNPETDRTSIAPMDVVEEVCQMLLKIKKPENMIPYLDERDLSKFVSKHNLKKSS